MEMDRQHSVSELGGHGGVAMWDSFWCAQVHSTEFTRWLVPRPNVKGELDEHLEII